MGGNRQEAISLKFATEFEHVKRDLPQAFKVKRSKVKVTTWVKICQITNNFVADFQISVKFGTDFDHVTFDVLQRLKVRCERSRSQRENVGCKIAVFTHAQYKMT